MGATKSLHPIPMVPSHAGAAGNEKADEWAKLAARNECGSEQLPYEFSSTSLAHLKRGIIERKWVEACSRMGSRFSKHHAYRPRKRWCDCRVKQSREHLLKSCRKWKSQQAILCAEVRRESKSGKRKSRYPSYLLEKSAALDFLSTGVGRVDAHHSQPST